MYRIKLSAKSAVRFTGMFKRKVRHLHFMRYSSHIQKMLTAQRLHYHNLALSARTVS